MIKEISMITYKEETIQNVYRLLNNIETKGIENAKRVALIAQLLDTPEKGEEDGSKDKEV